MVVVALSACADPDPSVAARNCVTTKLNGRAVNNATSRDVVAQSCETAIHLWALSSTQRAYGHAFDMRNAKVREEYNARKQAILWVLMPLDGDPKHM